MGEDVLTKRFLFVLFLFVASMRILVFSGNMFTTMVGWDGLGLVSFILVIYYQSLSRVDSGLVTVYRNRLGDGFFLIRFSWYFLSGGWGPDSFYGCHKLLCFLLFVGCFTKRAQAPFSAWLPAAIAAPTPVSSLVHSSTLVTAGIYVMLRYNVLFFSSFLVCSVSLVTLFVGGLRACFEKDLKKVVAISTLSQLGVMLYRLSLGFWKLCFVHMRMHALFKSLLFLRCGSLMSGLGGGQDSRFFGFSFSSVSGVCFFY